MIIMKIKFIKILKMKQKNNNVTNNAISKDYLML